MNADPRLSAFICGLDSLTGSEACGSELSVRRLVLHNRHRTAPTGARALDLHGKTRNPKPVRPRNRIEVRQLFDLAILSRDSREVSGPDVAAVSGRAVVSHHILERPVNGVCVDADHAHSLLHQPQSSFASESGLRVVVGSPDPAVGAGLKQDNIERLQAIADALKCPFENRDGDLRTRREVADVDHDARSVTPFERYLIDPARRLAL